MKLVHTEKPGAISGEEMSLDALKTGLMDIAVDSTGTILRSELVKIITTVGNKLTMTEANQVLSLITTKNGLIEISDLINALRATEE